MERSGKADPIGSADDQVLTNHRMARDGSVWRCLNGCGATVPFGRGCPELPADCTPRRWGDDWQPQP